MEMTGRQRAFAVPQAPSGEAYSATEQPASTAAQEPAAIPHATDQDRRPPVAAPRPGRGGVPRIVAVAASPRHMAPPHPIPPSPNGSATRGQYAPVRFVNGIAPYSGGMAPGAET